MYYLHSTVLYALKGLLCGMNLILSCQMARKGVNMACLYNQNQVCTNMCCTGSLCTQHPLFKVKQLYNRIKDMENNDDSQDYCEAFTKEGYNNAIGEILVIIEELFPESRK